MAIESVWFDDVPFSGSIERHVLRCNEGAPEPITMDFSIDGTDYLVGGTSSWNGYHVPSIRSADVEFTYTGSTRRTTGRSNYVY